jgi:hypothetical protein
MVDTEGAELPPDNDGARSFSLDIMTGPGSSRAWLGLSVPMLFAVPMLDGSEVIYSSGGVLTADLRSVLQDFIDDDELTMEPEHALAVAATLSEYAEKITSIINRSAPA